MKMRRFIDCRVAIVQLQTQYIGHVYTPKRLQTLKYLRKQASGSARHVPVTLWGLSMVAGARRVCCRIFEVVYMMF
jgi:hypothetical protein